MSTEETQDAVSRPAMTENKRPWSKGPWHVSTSFRLDRYYHAVSAPKWDALAQVVTMLEDEPNADCEEGMANVRLIAAAPELYEALKAHEAWEAKLIHTSLLGRISNAMMDELIKVQEMRNTALRAANPDAFDAEGEGE